MLRSSRPLNLRTNGFTYLQKPRSGQSELNKAFWFDPWTSGWQGDVLTTQLHTIMYNILITFHMISQTVGVQEIVNFQFSSVLDKRNTQKNTLTARINTLSLLLQKGILGVKTTIQSNKNDCELHQHNVFTSWSCKRLPHATDRRPKQQMRAAG